MLSLCLPASVGFLVWSRLDPGSLPVAGVASAVAVAVGGLVARVAARPVDRRLTQLGDALDKTLGRRVSSFGKRYREFVIESLRFVDLKGLATAGDHTPELDEVFVDVGLVARSPHQVAAGVLGDATVDVHQRYSIWRFLGTPEGVVLAILGSPGSGKTTLLRHVARRVAMEGTNWRRVPILLALRDYASWLSENPSTSLADTARRSLDELGFGEPDGWWEDQLSHGRCVVLLDGLDEVARQADRRMITSWVERQIARYPGNDFVMTSRPHGYRTARVNAADVLQVRPFTEDQVVTFLRGWYLATERRATGADGRAVEMRAQESASDLIGRLRATPALFDLTVNPLLLTMIALVHRYRGSLPGSRADLYGEVCQVMLWRRQEAKRLAAGELSGHSKQKLLAQLAFVMMTSEVRDLPRADIAKVLQRGLRRVSSDVTIDDFLADTSSNGLLVERESDVFAFAHHTFQEYLAATHIKDHNLVDVLTANVDNPWWRETTLLYVSSTDADPLVTACLKSRTINALALAFDCISAGGESDSALRRELEEILESAFRPNADQEHRRLVAGILVSRTFQQFVRTTAGTRMCTAAVPYGLYWLYRRETSHHSAPEDALTSDRRNSPVAGLSGAEGVGLTTWINTVAARPGEQLYRLPTLSEVQDPAVQPVLVDLARANSIAAIWVCGKAPSDVPLGWTLPGRSDPTEVHGEVLRQAVLDDVSQSPLMAQALLLGLEIASELYDEQSGKQQKAVLMAITTLAVALIPELGHRQSRDLALAHRRAQEAVFERATRLAEAVGQDRELRHANGLAREIVSLLSNLPNDVSNHEARATALMMELSREVTTRAGSTADAEEFRGMLANLREELDHCREFVGARYTCERLIRSSDVWFINPAVLASERSLAHQLAVALDADVATALGVTRTPGLPNGANFTRQADEPPDLIMRFQRHLGPALGSALARTVNSKDHGADRSALRGWFAEGFFDASGMRDDSVLHVDINSVPSLIRNACERARRAGNPSAGSFRVQATGALAQFVSTVFVPWRVPTVNEYRAIRLAALALAAEYTAADEQDLGDEFRTVAAGVTLLQRREGDPHYPRESLLLVLE